MEYNNNEILARVKQIQISKSKSVAHFSRLLDMRQVRVNNHLNGTSDVSTEMLFKILEVFPDISAEWLMRGVGDMYSLNSLESVASMYSKENERLQFRIKELEEERAIIKVQVETLRSLIIDMTGSSEVKV